jgi:hypothetical protein
MEARSTPLGQGLTASQDLLSLRLDVSKHVFAKGEPISIQVSAVNRSSQIVRVAKVTPWEAVKLVIVQDGQAVAPAGSGSGIRNRTPSSAELQPGESWIYVAYPDAAPYNAIGNWQLGLWETARWALHDLRDCCPCTSKGKVDHWLGLAEEAKLQ